VTGGSRIWVVFDPPIGVEARLHAAREAVGPVSRRSDRGAVSRFLGRIAANDEKPQTHGDERLEDVEPFFCVWSL